jgi:hypothetical protein
LAQPAEAKIIYTRTWWNVVDGTRLHLNNRGPADFSFRSYPDCPSGGPSCETYRKLVPLSGNAFAGRSGFPLALPKEAVIGPQDSWVSKPGMMAYVLFSGTKILRYSGNWVDIRNHYLGLQFSIHGKTRYGWARLTLKFTSKNRLGITATLTGYAYESIPGKSIVAGDIKGADVVKRQPATLGHLARGASVLGTWRGK